MSQRPTVLVDGMNLVWRNHHAFSSLRDTQGRPTGVFHGALTEITRLKEKFGEELVFCWDSRESWRRIACRTYKASRKKDPQAVADVNKQLDVLRPLLRNVLGFGEVECVGLEADDIMSLLSTAMTSSGRSPVMLFTNDQDLYQCLREDRVVVVRPSKTWHTVTEAEILQEYGLYPQQWAAYLAAGKDHSDGYKAFPGVGEKTALQLLHDGLEVRRPFAEQPEPVQKRLAKFEDAWAPLLQAYRLAKLPRLVDGVPKKYRTEAEAAISKAAAFNRTLPKDARNHLTAFCVDYELAFLLHKRSALL